MFFHFAGILFLALHAAESHGDAEVPQRLAQIAASPGQTVEIICRLPERSHPQRVVWYKEDEEKRLHKSKQSYIPRKPGGNPPSQLNLTLSKVQTKDSGLYYCIAHIAGNFTFVNGTRLIVFDASRQGLSVLAPPFAEGAQLDQSVPLLCLVFGANPAWASVSWNIGGDSSQEQKDVEVINGEGGFSMGSLKLVPREGWTPETAYSCSVPESRNLSGAVPTLTVPPHTGNCHHVLQIGLPCMAVLLLTPLSVLLVRKRLARGKKDQPAPPIALREIQQDGPSYAQLDFPSRTQEGKRKRREPEGEMAKP